jgi:hypothetical protein
LKQLQLIQILRIKARRPVNAGFAAVKAGRVNARRLTPKVRRRYPATRIQPSGCTKMGIRYARWFTAP